MFDMGFLELLVIGVIALIVLGPERLPKAARSVGLWVGKAKQSFNAVKVEIDRELQIQEMQQQFAEEKAKLEAQIKVDDLQESLSDIQQDIEETTAELTAPSDQKPASNNEEIPLKNNPNTEKLTSQND